MSFWDFVWWVIDIYESEDSSIRSIIAVTIISTVVFGGVLTICVIGIFDDGRYRNKVTSCFGVVIMLFLLLRTYYKLFCWCYQKIKNNKK